MPWNPPFLLDRKRSPSLGKPLAGICLAASGFSHSFPRGKSCFSFENQWRFLSMFTFYDDAFAQENGNKLGKCRAAHGVLKGASWGTKKPHQRGGCVCVAGEGTRLTTVTAFLKWSQRKLSFWKLESFQLDKSGGASLLPGKAVELELRPAFPNAGEAALCYNKRLLGITS